MGFYRLRTGQNGRRKIHEITGLLTGISNGGKSDFNHNGLQAVFFVASLVVVSHNMAVINIHFFGGIKMKQKPLRKNPSTPSKKYFTLLIRHKKSDLFEIHFGDYNRSVVMQEDEDTFDDFYSSQIIKTDEDQKSIDKKVREVNQVCGLIKKGELK